MKNVFKVPEAIWAKLFYYLTIIWLMMNYIATC